MKSDLQSPMLRVPCPANARWLRGHRARGASTGLGPPQPSDAGPPVHPRMRGQFMAQDFARTHPNRAEAGTASSRSSVLTP